MTKISHRRLRTWVEVDARAIEHNYQTFRKLLGPKVKLMAVVKSNAYGHGLLPLAKLLSRLGAEWLGVDSMVEARRLRAAGITTPILVLGYTLPALYRSAARLDVTLTISSPESLRQLFAARRPLPRCHLKIDTGMHRQGFLFEEFQPVLDRLPVTGIYSHLASSGSRLKASTLTQIREFEKFLALHQNRGWLRHLAATGTALAYPEARYDLVRIGLGLYGLWPSPELARRFGRRLKLRPALVWKTIISEVKTLPRGGRVGYDLTERVRPGTRLAVCPVGYWHGYPRALSGRGSVRIGRRRAKIIGRVSMDMIVVEVTKIKKARPGDEVILLDGKKGPAAEELAGLAQNSNYEIITRLNPLMERSYV